MGRGHEDTIHLGADSIVDDADGIRPTMGCAQQRRRAAWLGSLWSIGTLDAQTMERMESVTLGQT
jgi:hypothetical protein